MSCSYICLNCYISLFLSDSVPDKGAKEYAVYKPYLNYFYFLDAIVTVMFRVSILILLSRHFRGVGRSWILGGGRARGGDH